MVNKLIVMDKKNTVSTINKLKHIG